MLCVLLAYDAAGNILQTLDHMVARDQDGNVTGLVDFGAHEQAGGQATDIWMVGDPRVKGSKVWPEWLGVRVHEFRVELTGPPGRKWISALIHQASGYRRERAACEAAITAAPVIDGGRDLRAVLGGPGHPLALNADGSTSTAKPSGTPAHLPRVGMPTPQGS